MGMTAADYLQVLMQLLPPGKAYPRRLEGAMADTLAALADELARIDARIENLLTEAHPGRATELLGDWERVLALPDLIEFPAEDLPGRRGAANGKLVSTGGQSRAYFIDLAAALGFTITITEFTPYTCETPIDQPIYDTESRFVWRANVIEANAPLTLLETTFNHLKPAHTAVVIQS